MPSLSGEQTEAQRSETLSPALTVKGPGRGLWLLRSSLPPFYCPVSKQVPRRRWAAGDGFVKSPFLRICRTHSPFWLPSSLSKTPPRRRERNVPLAGAQPCRYPLGLWHHSQGPVTVSRWWFRRLLVIQASGQN